LNQKELIALVALCKERQSHYPGCPERKKIDEQIKELEKKISMDCAR